MSANSYAIDVTTRNAVFLQRLGGGEFNKVNAILSKMEREINGAISSASEGDFNSGQLLSDVQDITSERLQEVNESVRESAISTAAYTSSFETRLLKELSRVMPNEPDPSLIAGRLFSTALEDKPGNTNITLNDAINQYGTKKAAAFKQIVSDGILAGQASPELTAQVSEAMNLTRRQAETLVRTVTNSAAQTGRAEAFQQNADILEGMEVVAVLDSRTTRYCSQIDGEILPLDAAKPPYHWGCRTQLVPVIKQQYTEPNIQKGEKKTETGEISPNTSYQSWLKKQPAEFQDEVLGPNRGALFRRGGIDLKGFVNQQTDKTYTLEELYNLEPMAFAKAGLVEAPAPEVVT